jgi:predicted nucleotidyltransferase
MNIEQLLGKEVRSLCKIYNVRSLFAFGSVTRDDFSRDSDVDLVVDFNEEDPFIYTELYFNLKKKLENLLNRPVDLLEERAIKNRFFRQQLDLTKVKIYES